MKEMGFDIEIISSITGLPIEEIKKIYRPYDEKDRLPAVFFY